MLPKTHRLLLAALLTLVAVGLIGCDHEVKEAVRPAPAVDLTQHA